MYKEPDKEKQSPVAERGITYYSSPEEQDTARLKEAINRSDKEKFYFLMNLMKMQQVMKRGIIHHKS